MYIKSVEIEQIRSIQKFKMDFKNPAGWHVLIGDNGAGKSSIMRSIALALVGPDEALGLRADWREWLNRVADEGRICLSIEPSDIDKHTGKRAKLKNQFIDNIISFKRNNGLVSFSSNKHSTDRGIDPANYNWGEGSGWFSVAYGPYRRFEGGSSDWPKVFYSQPKLGAHLSAFGEDVALTEAVEWLVKLNYQRLEQRETATIIDDIKKLVNSPDFLPLNVKIDSISSAGVMFKDGNGSLIHVNQLSDGYRSMLSLTFELLRQLERVYGADEVFRNIRQDNMVIELPGIVLIDEIDAHLHPTWQTRIGQWFVKYFPNIQFIVSTHSPLICRACENGTIWRLAAPGSAAESKLVEGDDRNKLIYGNILDAYGTDIFGSDVTINIESIPMKEELVRLSKKRIAGALSITEEKTLLDLRKTFSTDDKIEL